MPDETDRPVPDPEAPREWPAADGVPTPRIGARAARRRTRRRRALAAVGAAGLVAVGGVAAVLALSGSPSRPTAHRARPTVITAPTVPTTSATPTTAVPRASSPAVVFAQQYDGVYVGTYTNLTEHTSGTATLELRIDPVAATLTAKLNLTGDLYGAGAAAQVRDVEVTLPLGNPNAPATVETPAFGQVTAQIMGLGISMTAPNVPDPAVHTFQLSGQLRGDHKGFDATFNIGYRDGRTAQGNATVYCSVMGNRPTQVGTICENA